MLIITRRLGESFVLLPSNDIDPHMTVAKLFANGPIQVSIVEQKGCQVRVGIEAPSEVSILRSEILSRVTIPFDEAEPA